MNAFLSLSKIWTEEMCFYTLLPNAPIELFFFDLALELPFYVTVMRFFRLFKVHFDCSWWQSLLTHFPTFFLLYYLISDVRVHVRRNTIETDRLFSSAKKKKWPKSRRLQNVPNRYRLRPYRVHRGVWSGPETIAVSSTIQASGSRCGNVPTSSMADRMSTGWYRIRPRCLAKNDRIHWTLDWLMSRQPKSWSECFNILLNFNAVWCGR